jgi:hypothetical protein
MNHVQQTPAHSATCLKLENGPKKTHEAILKKNSKTGPREYTHIKTDTVDRRPVLKSLTSERMVVDAKLSVSVTLMENEKTRETLRQGFKA